MIRFNNISFSGVVGYRNPTTSGYDIVNSTNQGASTGLYVQGASRLATIKNLKDSIEDKDITNEKFNEILVDILKDSTANVLNQVFEDKPNLMQNELVYRYGYDFQKPITLSTAFVGFELLPSNKKEITNILNSAVLSFNGDDSVKLLLFHSGSKSVTQNKTVAVSDGETTEVLNWVLDYTTGTGGKFYLGYLTSGLSTSPYNRQYQLGSIPSSFYHLGIKPIKVTSHNSETLFDVNNIEYTSETWGLNLDVSTYWDYTDLVNKNKSQFAKAVQIQSAIEILKIIANSTRSNDTEQHIKQRAELEINGNTLTKGLPESVGLINDLKGEISRLKRMFAAPRVMRSTLRV